MQGALDPRCAPFESIRIAFSSIKGMVYSCNSVLHMLLAVPLALALEFSICFQLYCWPLLSFAFTNINIVFTCPEGSWFLRHRYMLGYKSPSRCHVCRKWWGGGGSVSVCGGVCEYNDHIENDGQVVGNDGLHARSCEERVGG
jgi:hypothetical protein